MNECQDVVKAHLSPRFVSPPFAASLYSHMSLEALGCQVLAKVFGSLPTLLEYLQASVQYTQVGHGSGTVTRAQ